MRQEPGLVVQLLEYGFGISQRSLIKSLRLAYEYLLPIRLHAFYDRCGNLLRADSSIRLLLLASEARVKFCVSGRRRRLKHSHGRPAELMAQ